MLHVIMYIKFCRSYCSQTLTNFSWHPRDFIRIFLMVWPKKHLSVYGRCQYICISQPRKAMWAKFHGKHLFWVFWTLHESPAVLVLMAEFLSEGEAQETLALHQLAASFGWSSSTPFFRVTSSFLPALSFHDLFTSILFCFYHRAFEYAFLTSSNSPSRLFPKLISFDSSSVSAQISLLQVKLPLTLGASHILSHGSLS